MKVLVITLVLVLCTLTLSSGSRASPQKHWPDPPASWVHSSTMTCVRYQESKDGRASANIYEMMPPTWSSVGGTGWAGSASRAEQDYRAFMLWKRSGCHQPWGRYDGCC